MARLSSGALDRLRATPVSAIVAGLAFLILYWEPAVSLVRDWWALPEAGHGLLLGPLAVVLAWRKGWADGSVARPRAALLILAGAVLLRFVSGLAAELFTMRLSMFGAAAALVVYARGVGQLLHWWMPGVLLLLSVPLPAVLLNTLAFPLQLQASRMGAALLDARNVPVRLAGNIIHLPGQSLFVTEACSGLRSLTALLSLGVLIGGLWLRQPWSRILLVLSAIPVAMALNALRIFLTGFLVFYVAPEFGRGFMHYTEGWVLFVVAFAILGAAAWALWRAEAYARRGMGT
ncbi:MAG TPA: exosortase/archaeosortase family protein [Gemmatimonadales bacterium]|nr:exosortase/archaeosortase family protein [Gemmatimonadales bacterium]